MLPLMLVGLLIFPLSSTIQAQSSWDAVKAVPLGTKVRINDSITGRLDSVDDTQITIGGRRLRQDVIRRVERVESRRGRNAGLAFLAGFGVAAIAAKINGSALWHAAFSGAVVGGFTGVGAALKTESSSVVIYQRWEP
jgi:hypothetical protein